MDENKGFEIKCLNCGSTKVHIEQDGDYDWEENWIPYGWFICCEECGQYE